MATVSALPSTRRGIRLNPDLPDTVIPGAPFALVPFASIFADAQLQQRASIDADVVADYASGIRDWIAQAPLVVFFDSATYWLADGFHRHLSCEVEGIEEVPCIVHEGTRADALRFALGANAIHGKQRTGADLAKAYQRAVSEEFCKADDPVSVAAILKCSQRHARRLTDEARNRKDLEDKATIERRTAEGATQSQIASELGISQTGVSKILKHNRTLSKSAKDSTLNPSKPAVSFPSAEAQLRAETLAREMGYASLKEALDDGKYDDLYPNEPLPLDPPKTVSEQVKELWGDAAQDAEAFRAATLLLGGAESFLELFRSSPSQTRVLKSMNEAERKRYLRSLRDLLSELQSLEGLIL